MSERKYITAEGPSSELGPFQGLRHEAGHSYPAAHEPVRFIPYDLDITVRAIESAGWWGRFASFQTDKRRKAEGEAEQLRAQLETARKALGYAIDCLGRGLNGASVRYDLKRAISQIGAGQTGPICLACIKAGEHHAKWCAGQVKK